MVGARESNEETEQMSDTITEVAIRPAENGFVIWVYGGKDGLRPYIAADVERLADVLHRIFPKTVTRPAMIPVTGGANG